MQENNIIIIVCVQLHVRCYENASCLVGKFCVPPVSAAAKQPLIIILIYPLLGESAAKSMDEYNYKML